MDILTSYIIKSSVAAGILYFYYHLALKNRKFHSYNRLYLLLSVVISLVIPFMNFSWFYIKTAQNTPLTDFVNRLNVPVADHPATLFAPGLALFSISVLISLLLLVSLALKIRWIYHIKRSNPNTKMRGFTLIETDLKQAPFSFLSNLFWKQGLSASDTNGEKIFKHELTHIRQKHTYDKLFTQIVSCLFWMNPFYWLIQRELNTIHEFMADAASVDEGDTASFAEMLLHSYNEGSYLSPAHAFFNSSIKRRLIMISSSNKTRHSWLRRLLALPVTLFLLAVLSVSIQAQPDIKTDLQPVKEVQQSSEDTIPKSAAAPSKSSPEPIKVMGYPVEKKQGPEPITVTGYPSGEQQTQDRIGTSVAGYPSDRKQSLEPITVTGYPSGKQRNAVQARTGTTTITADRIIVLEPSDGKQSSEPITVTGYKSRKRQNAVQARIGTTTITADRIIVLEPSDRKQSPEPIMVTGHPSGKQ